MKAKTITIAAVLSLIIVSLVAFFLMQKSESIIISDTFNIDIPTEETVTVVDNKGAFGEGTRYRILEFSEDNSALLANYISENIRWSNFYPIPQELIEIVNYYNIELPSISHGRYIYEYDVDAFYPNSDLPSSFNLKLLIYDFNSKMLHYIDYSF